MHILLSLTVATTFLAVTGAL